jgi:ComF family protein
VQGRAALVYRDTGRKLVLSLKHGDRQEIARPASLWMANTVREIMPENALIAPVPLHWLRLIKRRYNQSALLAKGLSARTGHVWCPDLLERIRRTKPLDGLSGHERHEMLENSIRVHPKRRHRLIGRPILLVDDVMTSGATLKAATNACLDAGSGPVRVVTLARVAKDT